MLIKTKPGRAPAAFEEKNLITSITRESFYEFVQEFWSQISQEKLILNWHIEYLCDELQTMMARVFKGLPKLYDLIINISPGSTKSTIASVMLPIWCWTRMPSFRSICGSYAYSLAMDLSRKSRDIVRSEKFQECFNLPLKIDQDTKGYFANVKGGTRYAVGIGGSVTGMHGHALLVDDPLDPAEAISEAELKNCNHWMREILPTRKVDKRVTPLILIMQRLAQNDPTGEMLDRLTEKNRHKVKHICLPAEETEDIKPEFLRSNYIDGLMDPIRLPREVLVDAAADLGQFGYAGQFLQNPIPLGGGMFRTTRLHIGPPPGTMKYLVRYWDKAGTAGGGAFTVGVLMGVDADGKFWVLDVVRGQWESNEREKIILETARIDGKRVVIGVEQEPGSGGKESAEATVHRLAGWRVRIDKVGAAEGNKVLRADPFSVQVNAGHVWLKEGTEWLREYIEELRFFPTSRYKDQVDASSGAFNMLTKPKVKIGGFGVLLKK